MRMPAWNVPAESLREREARAVYDEASRVESEAFVRFMSATTRDAFFDASYLWVGAFLTRRLAWRGLMLAVASPPESPKDPFEGLPL
jgi:hypothetical protein